MNGKLAHAMSDAGASQEPHDPATVEIYHG
jgi:hypothetical protein